MPRSHPAPHRRRDGHCLAAVILCALALAPRAAGAAAMLDNFRQGSHAGTSSLSIGFTVGAGADRLLLVGVSTARGDVSVTGVTWRGGALTRVIGLPVNQGGRECRAELWRLVDPPSGIGQIAVNLTGTTPMGMGMAAYTGVDQQSPVSPMVTGTGTTSPVRIPIPVSGPRPILGMACLGGTWAMLNGPDAVPGRGDVLLWDFTEQGVVGLGSHQAVMIGSAGEVSWDVTFAGSFSWGAIGLSITPAATAPLPPDAGPDLARDLALPPDLAPPPVDVALPVAEDADPPGGDPPADAEEPPALDAAPAPAADAAPAVSDDVASADDPDGGTTARDVNLRVGCACQLGGPEGRAPLLPVLVVIVLFALLLRRRLI